MSDAWSDLREGAIRKFCFVEIDLAGHSAIAANNSKRDAEATFSAFLDFIEEKVTARGGHVWGMAGDGGLFAFYDDDETEMAEQGTGSALDIVDGLGEFNQTKSKVKQQVRVRIAVHLGDARYYKNTGRIQSDDINFVAHLEKGGTKPDSVSISGSIYREIVNEEMKARFRDNGTFEGRPVYSSAPPEEEAQAPPPAVAAVPEPEAPPPEQPEAPLGPVEIKNRYAVVIGISEYQDPSIPRLKYAAEDAKAVHQTLIRHGGYAEENIRLLVNDQATYREIKSTIGTFLPRNAGKDDAVFIYFAGHGCPDVDHGDNPEDQITKYLAPYDAQREDLFSTAFPMDELSAILKRVESQYVVMALDTCYSGQAGQGRTFETVNTRAVLSNAFLNRIAGQGRVVITAADVNELSMELDKYSHGIFTHHLLEGMRGQADLDQDGLVGVQELYDYIQDRVYKDSMAAGGRQHPLLRGSLAGKVPLTHAQPVVREPEPVVDPVAKDLEEMMRLRVLGHYDEALEVLARVLPLAGDRTGEVRRAIGKTHLLKGDVASSIEAYRMAIEAEPSSPAGHAEYSGALLKSGDLTGAIESLRRAVRMDASFREQGVLIEMDLQEKIRERPADWRLRFALTGLLVLQENLEGAMEQLTRSVDIVSDEEMDALAEGFREDPAFADLRATPKGAEVLSLLAGRQEALAGYRACLETGDRLRKERKFAAARQALAEGAQKWPRYREPLERKAAEAAALDAQLRKMNLERLGKEPFLDEFVEGALAARAKHRPGETDPRATERPLLEKGLAASGFLPLDAELAFRLFQSRCAARTEQMVAEQVDRARRSIAAEAWDRAQEAIDTILALDPASAMGKALVQRVADLRKQQSDIGKAMALVEKLIRDGEYEKAATLLRGQAKLLGGRREYPQLLKIAEEGKTRETAIQSFFTMADQKEAQKRWLESLGILTQIRLAQPDDPRVEKRYQETRRRVREWEAEQAQKAPKGMVLVPSGYFAMGEFSGPGRVRTPRCPVFLGGFYIDRVPVTFGEYRRFLEHIEKTGDHGKCHPDEPRKKSHRPRKWADMKLEGDDLPVVGIDWFDAFAFAAWAEKRLLSEAEWEKAASWKEEEEAKLLYPWGNEFDSARCNSAENSLGRLTPVTRYEKSPGPSGALDLCGNSWEWCADWHSDLAFRRRLVTNPKGPGYGEMRILRGGAWDSDRRTVTTIHRSRAYPFSVFPTAGFRCARNSA